jgi:hypothetical protein
MGVLTPLGARGGVTGPLGTTNTSLLGELVLDITLSQANYSGGQYGDISEYGNHGTPSAAPSFEADHNGNANGAMTFDGSVYVTVPDNDSLDAPNDGLTILVWAKVNVPFPSTMTFVSKWNGDNSVCQYLLQSRSGLSRFRIYQSNTDLSGYAFRESLNLTDGGWRHLVSQWNGETGGGLGLQTFRDGSLSNHLTNDTGFPGFTANSLPLTIGARSDGSYPFTGAISRVQIYRKELSAAEIAEAYNNT